MKKQVTLEMSDDAMYERKKRNHAKKKPEIQLQEKRIKTGGAKAPKHKRNTSSFDLDGDDWYEDEY